MHKFLQLNAYLIFIYSTLDQAVQVNVKAGSYTGLKMN